MAKGSGRGPSRSPDPKIELQNEPSRTSGITWGVTVTAIVSQGNTILASRPVQFFQGTAPAGHACLTDVNGRVSYDFDGLPLDTSQQVTVEAQLVGTPFRARVIIPAPKGKEAERQIPYDLLVKPARAGNQITFMIRVTDGNERNIPKSKITIIDSDDPNPPQTLWTDEDGELIHTIDLAPNKERDISVYVAGFGEGVNMTFYGRKR